MKRINRRTRNLVCFILTMALLVTIPSFALGSTEKTLSNSAHVYKITPGSDEWAELTIAERLASCKVSKAEVENMTTAALIDTVVNYPYLVNIYAYDTIELGIEMVSNHFPGIKELLARNDATKELEKYLDKAKEAKESTSFEAYAALDILTILESAQNFNNLSSTDNISRFMLTNVYTPSNRQVPAVEGYSWYDRIGLTDQQEIADYLNTRHTNFVACYPGITEVLGENPSYNCHSYAWHSRSQFNSYWIDNPDMYTTDASYSATNSASGEIITYKSLATGEYIHSAVVRSASSIVMVTSKWGAFKVYRHSVSNCPYIVDRENNSATSINYWKLNPGYTPNY